MPVWVKVTVKVDTLYVALTLADTGFVALAITLTEANL